GSAHGNQGVASTERRITVGWMQTTTLLILGASGDLAARLLLPALGELLQQEPDREIRLLGAGADDWTPERWQQTVATAFAASDAAGELHRVADTGYTR